MPFFDHQIDPSVIRLRRSFEPGESPTPGALRPGEIAVNAADGTLFVQSFDGDRSIRPYEEGNWTPTLTAATTTPTVTYTNRDGYYARTGNSVTLWGRLRVATISGGSGNALITGLPFRPGQMGGSVTPFYAGATSYQFGFQANPPTSLIAQQTTNAIQTMAIHGTSLSISFSAIGVWKAGSLLVFSVSYYTKDSFNA